MGIYYLRPYSKANSHPSPKAVNEDVARHALEQYPAILLLLIPITADAHPHGLRRSGLSILVKGTDLFLHGVRSAPENKLWGALEDIKQRSEQSGKYYDLVDEDKVKNFACWDEAYLELRRHRGRLVTYQRLFDLTA